MQGRLRETIVLQFAEKGNMIESVEGFAKIEEEEESNMLSVDPDSDIICKFNEGCLCTILFS